MKFLHIGMDGMMYPLLKKFMAEGLLPTFEKLIAQGTINKLMPSIPAWTPTNWSAQVTGAQPGSHGLGGWTKHHKTDPMSVRPIESWESTDWGPETVWEVAEEAGLKSLITHYPVATWPSPINNGYVVAPGFREPPFTLSDAGEYYCSPKVAASETKVAPELRSVDRLEEGAPKGSTAVPLRPATGWANLAGEAWEGELPAPPYHKPGPAELFYLLVRPGVMDRVWVYAAKDAAEPMAEVPLGEWSPFVYHDFSGTEATMRWRLLTLGVGPTVHMLRCQAYATNGTAYPAGLEQEILKEVGPWFPRFTMYPRSQPELEAFLDEVRYQGFWQAKVAAYVQEKHGWDMHWCHWHIFDNINHPTVNYADPEGPNYDPVVGEWNMEAQRRSYMIGDEVLAEFLKLADDDTVVMVVSDHAMPPAHRWADIDIRLMEAGLMAFDPETREIDLSKSLTYTWPERGSEIFVNLQGREPTGVVPAEDYEKVQERILDALFDWRDPETGQRVIPLALKLQDAQIIGYWGEDNGDVVFVFNHGIGWGAVDGNESIGPGKGALHGSQLPTHETKHFTTMGMMILAGPGVVDAGYERDWHKWGLIREIDVAPIACHLMGLRMPRHNQGAVPMDLVE